MRLVGAAISMSIAAVSWALKQDLPASIKMVLIVLADHHNGETGQCNPSARRIATMAGVSERTVERSTQALAEAGHLSIKANHREDGSLTSNQYVLAVGSDKVTLGGDTVTPGGSDKVTLGGDTVTEQEPVIELGIIEPGIEGSDPTTWPESYSLLYGIRGLQVTYGDYQDWVNLKCVPETFLAKTAYALRDWLNNTAAGQKRMKQANFNPWLTFTSWTARDFKPEAISNGRDGGWGNGQT